jgi:hypothetical protein
MYLTVSVAAAVRLQVASIVLVAALAASAPCAAQAIDAKIDLPNASVEDRARVSAAAYEALQQYGAWLGPLPIRDLAIGERTQNRARDTLATTVAIEVPWWSAPSAMEVEAAVAYGIARAYWPTAGAGEDRVNAADALSWYLQARIVERLFNLRYFGEGYSSESLRLFGGSVPWDVPSLRLTRWRGGLARDVFLHAHGAGGSSRPQGRRLPSRVTAATVRGALAFAALERYLGWPTLQGALRVLAQQPRDRPIARADVVSTLSSAVGQDLAWFFDVAFDPSRPIDYTLASFTTRPLSPCIDRNCYRTEVVMARLGSAPFTGSSRVPAGAYEAGAGIVLEVDFEDGQSVTATWDGRTTEKTVIVESAAMARTARLDPAGVLLLDAHTLDHTRRLPGDTNVPVAKWTARWAVWLQNAMLAYTMLF